VTFEDRRDAGRRLAAVLATRSLSQPVALGLPRGGVVVAAEVASVLGCPLDVVVVRKLGAPVQPELAMGAIAEGGVRVLDEVVAREVGADAAAVAAVERRERDLLEARVRRYRDGRPRVPLEGRTAVVIDDGIATGATARAACIAVREAGAARVVMAAPVAPRGAELVLDDVADEVVVVESPARFAAVGRWYRDFTPTTDDEVVALLRPPPGSG
jgi:putative phosphoribosyl transferase